MKAFTLLGLGLGLAVVVVACSTTDTTGAPPEDDAGCAGDACAPPPDAGCTSGAQCGDVCVDTSRDRAHCGGCGRACPGDEVCLAGACVCPTGFVQCGGECVDPRTNEAHCGASLGCGEDGGNAGVRCNTDYECRNAACWQCKTWQKPISHPIIDGGNAVAAADVDGDGKLDIVVSADEHLVILRGKGDGSFETIQMVRASTSGVRLVDMDGDGKLDIVTMYRAPSESDAGVGVFRGFGDGTFATMPRWLIPPEPGLGAAMPPESFHLIDLNGDGKLDIATLESPYGAEAVVVFLNRGDGTFSSARYPFSGFHIATGDLDGDGKPDLVALGPEGIESAVHVLLNRGDGSFVSGGTYVTDRPLRSLTVGDLTGDGHADVIASDRRPAGSVAVFAGKGDGTLEAAKAFFAGGVRGLSQVEVVDVTDDGIDDLVLTSVIDQPSDDHAGDVSVRVGEAPGKWLPPQSYFTGTYTRAFTTADVDGDRRTDFIAVKSWDIRFGFGISEVSVLLGAVAPGCGK